MKHPFFAVALVSCAAILITATTADAGGRRSNSSLSQHSTSDYYRGGPQVRGFVERRGGYSYSAEDTINTYNDARTTYGSVNSYRDPFLDRQTTSGPFDNGYFFDSGTAPRGGNSPYLN